MILLTSSHSSVSSAVYSGIVAAIVAGVVALAGHLLSAYVQRKNNQEVIDSQKENAKMERVTDLMYKNQVEWFESLRQIIADLVVSFGNTNAIIEDIHYQQEQNIKLNSQATSFEFMQHGQRADQLKAKSDKMFDDLERKVSLTRLYLYEDNLENKELLDKLQALIESLKEDGKVPPEQLDSFVDYARRYLANQMKQLEEKIK